MVFIKILDLDEIMHSPHMTKLLGEKLGGYYNAPNFYNLTVYFYRPLLSVKSLLFARLTRPREFLLRVVDRVEPSPSRSSASEKEFDSGICVQTSVVSVFENAHE